MIMRDGEIMSNNKIEIPLSYYPIYPLEERDELKKFFGSTARGIEAQKLASDIKNIAVGCFMVSGYRGSGKTSFVNYVTTLIQKPEYIVVRLNLSHKCDAKEFVLRLFRNLRDTIYEDDEKRKKVEDKQEIKQNLNLAHLRSFCDVQTFVNEGLKEVDKETAIRTSKRGQGLSILGAISCFIRGGVEKRKWNEDEEGKSDESGMEYTAEGSWKLGFLKYDYELAEYEFKKIIASLTSNSKLFKKIVFTIDDIDKMDLDEAMDVLKNMRSLLFTKNSIFILVGSKEFSTKWRAAKLFHEATALDSLFTHVIYVPWMSCEEMEEIYLRLKPQRGISVPEKRFLNHLIYRAAGSPRDFFRYLWKYIKWGDDEKAIISIEKISPIETLWRLETGLITIIKKFVQENKFEDAEFMETKEMFALSLFKDLIYRKGFVFTTDDIFNSISYREYCKKNFIEGYQEPKELVRNLMDTIKKSDLIQQSERHYFLKDPELGEIAKREKEKIGKGERTRNYAEKDLLDLRSALQEKETIIKQLKDLLQ